MAESSTGHVDPVVGVVVLREDASTIRRVRRGDDHPGCVRVIAIQSFDVFFQGMCGWGQCVRLVELHGAAGVIVPDFENEVSREAGADVGLSRPHAVGRCENEVRLVTALFADKGIQTCLDRELYTEIYRRQ